MTASTTTMRRDASEDGKVALSQRRSIVATDQRICLVVGLVHELFVDVPGWIAPFKGLNVGVEPYSSVENSGTLAHISPLGWPLPISFITSRFFDWPGAAESMRWNAEVGLTFWFLKPPVLGVKLHIQSLPRLTITKWETATHGAEEMLREMFRDKAYLCHPRLLVSAKPEWP